MTEQVTATKDMMKQQRNKEFWHAKHPVIKQKYKGRPLPNNGESFSMDVTHFLWDKDVSIQTILAEKSLRHDHIDKSAHSCQKYVCDILKYVSDTSIGRPEYWLFPQETLELQQGDCEDGAILMASLILNCIGPDHAWRVRVAAGWVDDNGKPGGHAYVVYCRASDNEWVILDWCYDQDPNVEVPNKPVARDVARYKEVWFSFNHKFAYSNTSFEMDGRVKELPENDKVKKALPVVSGSKPVKSGKRVSKSSVQDTK